MKRLLCILSGMNRGGAETFLMKVYRQLDKMKYQMDFCINVKDKTAYEDEIISLGGRVYKIPSKSENPFEFKKQLAEIVRFNKYKNVLRITSNAAGFWDLKIAKQAGATHTIARSSNASDGGSIKTVLAHKLGQALWMKYVDTMIAPSDLAAKYTFGEKNYENGAVQILNNGLDLELFKYNDSKRKIVRTKHGINSDVTVIGHVGRFSKQKNHDFLIEIFDNFHKSIPKSCLLLVGQGELRALLEQKVRRLGLSDFVIFAGISDDVPSYLSAMDVFVFPSFYEGMPNTVIEAQAAGLPCVISDSITRGAKITDLVNYVSLRAPVKQWSDMILKYVEVERKSTYQVFVKRGYNIEAVALHFTKIVFEE